MSAKFKARMEDFAEREKFHLEFNYQLDQSAKTAERAAPSPLRVRRVVVDGKTFVALSADELIRAQSEASRARPGHLCD